MNSSLVLVSLALAAPQPLTFKTQEIETGLGVGYAVLAADINGDGKPDVVVVDKTRVLWYENATWKRHVVIEGKTKPDNVCIAAHDVDGDGKIDLALGSGWQNLQSKFEGPVYWLRRGKTLDEPWQVFPITEEICVHRIRFGDLDGDGKPELIVSPLLGKGSTAQKNWMDGAPVRTFALQIPKDPTKDRWTPMMLDETMHVIHNVWPISADNRKGMDVLAASYEGVSLLQPKGEQWTRKLVGAGNQEKPNGNRGASEIKMGTLNPKAKPGDGPRYIATVEPWHGHQVVVYTPPEDAAKALWDRHMIDDQLKWGHGVWCADLDGDGKDELIIGVRDNLSMKPGEKCGVRIYRATDARGTKWERTLVDEGGVAIEDLTAADLDGDGKIDLIAAGRQTKNVRIYWNTTGK